MTRIKVITPIVTQGVRDIADLREMQDAGLEIGHTLIDSGPSSIESAFEESLCIPGTLAQALKAQSEGYDAVVIDCFADPGLQAARELLDIHAFGPGECSVHAAAMLGQRIGIVSVGESVRPLILEMVHRSGVESKLASLRMVGIPVLALHSTTDLPAALAEQARRAVLEDGADVIVLGCTGFLGCAQKVAAVLREQGLEVPVIDPIPMAIRVARALCESGLRHSKRGWPKPVAKRIGGYELLQSSLANSSALRTR